MSNTIGFGQAAVNNTIDYGQGATDNTINWGKSQTLSPGGETNITGTPSTPSFTNVNSFSFDGVDDYFIIPSAITLVDDFSISAWIKPSNTTDTYNMILSCGSVGPYFAVRSGGKLHFYLSSTYETGAGVIQPNVWSHVAVTRTSGVLQLYINGAAFGSTSTQSNVIGSQTYNIGRYAPTNGFQFTGNIDELALFNSALSQSDITAIYNNGEPQSLDAYSPFVWFRMGDNATWNGFAWTMTSVGTDTRTARSANMVEANRTTDVPTASSFSNTKSIALDGVDDEVSMPFTSTSTTGSISVWIKPTDYTTGSQIVWLYVGSGYRDLITLSQRTDGTLAVSAVDGGSTRWRVETDNAVVSNGTWTHVVFSFDGSNGTIYINGSTVPQTYTVTTNTSWWWDDLLPTQQRLGILRVNGYSAQQRYNGNIEEQSVFTSALSSTEVSAIYNNGLPTDLSSQSNILAWYRCGDGDTAPTLIDNIGSNNGTMTNFTTFSTDVPT